jgi:hypothetical protein
VDAQQIGINRRARFDDFAATLAPRGDCDLHGFRALNALGMPGWRDVIRKTIRRDDD